MTKLDILRWLDKSPIEDATGDEITVLMPNEDWFSLEWSTDDENDIFLFVEGTNIFIREYDLEKYMTNDEMKKRILELFEEKKNEFIKDNFDQYEDQRDNSFYFAE